MSKKNNEGKTGALAFDSYYGGIFAERWGKLKQSLLSENVYTKIQHESCGEYFLDPASVCAALCLPVENCGKLLDMCAAPGGKTLVLSSVMGDECCLHSNERSPARKQRLDKVVSECLPDVISSRVRTSCSDGALWCTRETESFDAVLLDAPCSSERHVLNDEKYLKDWTASRTKNLAHEQWALLSSAFRLLKTGGALVYATCALSPVENDGNIQKLLKKFTDASVIGRDEVRKVFSRNLGVLSGKSCLEEWKTIGRMFELAETTEFGYHVLPDTSGGGGPLYFCAVLKKSQE